MDTTNMTRQQLEEEIARLKDEMKTKPRRITHKPSPKGTGAYCVYGLQRYPVTLYPQQWIKLFAPEQVAEILAGIEEYRDELSWKE